jgi:hypothetical protein
LVTKGESLAPVAREELSVAGDSHSVNSEEASTENF